MNEITTIGVKLKYCVGSANERPTSGYTALTNVTDISDYNPEPDTLETTDLDVLQYKTYTLGLQDPGGAQSITVNITKEFKTAWAEVVSSYEGGKANGNVVWFETWFKGLSDMKDETPSYYIPGIPVALGKPAVSVNEVYSGDVYFIPTGEGTWAAASE